MIRAIAYTALWAAFAATLYTLTLAGEFVPVNPHYPPFPYIANEWGR